MSRGQASKRSATSAATTAAPAPPAGAAPEIGERLMSESGRRNGGAPCGVIRAVVAVGAGIAAIGIDGATRVGAGFFGAAERSMSRIAGGDANAGVEAAGAAVTGAGVTGARGGTSAGASRS